jgi:glycosyltransferase involved in cell wall biosynthesis
MPDPAILSACLIVRNEEKYLDACLSSIRPVVDEIIVVDTGSSDHSPDIAVRYGARLFSFPWGNDFAAARNRALELASGNWILSIDADETLRPMPAAEIRSLLREPDAIAYFTNLSPRANWTEMRNLRLFRSHPLIRYEGSFHENLWGALNIMMLRDGACRIGESAVTFDHHGFDGDQTAKHERNIPLLLQVLERSPESTFHRQHLAFIYAELGRRVEAEEAWMKNVSILKKKRAIRPVDGLSYIGLIQFRLEAKRDVRELMREALHIFPANPQVHWLYGKFLMDEGRYAEAAECFNRLIQWGLEGNFDRSIPYDKRIFSDYAYEAIALCHFRRGEYSESRRFYKMARACDPGNAEYGIKERLCAILENGPPQIS